MALNRILFFTKISLQMVPISSSPSPPSALIFPHPANARASCLGGPSSLAFSFILENSLKPPVFPHLWLWVVSLPWRGASLSSVRCFGKQRQPLQPQNAHELSCFPFCTWKTVTMAQSKESKFFLSGSVSPSRSEANLQPKRCIPRMLQGRESSGSTRGPQHKPVIIPQG